MINIFLRMKECKLKREYKDINKEEMNKLVRQGALLVDIRSPQEYKEGHLNSAISLPEYEIKNKCETVLKDKNKIIIVYCTSGERSKKAQKRLQQKGYINVYNLLGGIEKY